MNENERIGGPESRRHLIPTGKQIKEEFERRLVDPKVRMTFDDICEVKRHPSYPHRSPYSRFVDEIEASWEEIEELNLNMEQLRVCKEFKGSYGSRMLNRITKLEAENKMLVEAYAIRLVENANLKEEVEELAASIINIREGIKKL